MNERPNKQISPLAQAKTALRELRAGIVQEEIEIQKIKTEAYAITAYLIENAWQQHVERRGEGRSSTVFDKDYDQDRERVVYNKKSTEEVIGEASSVEELSSTLSTVIQAELEVMHQNYFGEHRNHMGTGEDDSSVKRLRKLLIDLREDNEQSVRSFIEQGFEAARITMPITLTAGIAKFVETEGRLPEPEELNEITTALWPIASSLARLNFREIRAFVRTAGIVDDRHRDNPTGMFNDLNIEIGPGGKPRFTSKVGTMLKEADIEFEKGDEGVTIGCPALAAAGSGEKTIMLRELWNWAANLTASQQLDLASWERFIDTASLAQS